MSEHLLGKSELLAWACQHSGVPQCTKYDDLKDGFVFVCLAERLWPHLVDPIAVRSQRRGTRTSKANWDTLRSVMTCLGLPVHLCDPKGVAAGHQRPCYNLLVMFYFLTKLSVSSDFSVDFAHPIDDQLAAFLQSPQSIQCLRREDTPLTDFAHTAPPSGKQMPTGTRSLSPAHPAPSPNQRAPVATPRREMPSQHKEVSFDEQTAAVTARDPMRTEVQHLRRVKELLEREVAHIRSMSRHALEQQRQMVDAEMQRTLQQFQTQLTTVRMDAEFESQQCFQSLMLDYERVLDELTMERQSFKSLQPSNPERQQHELHSLRQTNAVLQGKLQAVESALQQAHRHAQQYKEAADAQRQSSEKFLQSMQSAVSKYQGFVGQNVASLTDNDVQQQGTAATAEKLAYFTAFKKIILQLEESRILLQRREEEALLLTRNTPTSGVEGGSIGAAAPIGELEIERMKQHLDRLTHANKFLQEQLAMLRKSDTQPSRSALAILNSADLHSSGGTNEGASSFIGLSSVDVACAHLLQRLQGIPIAADQLEAVRTIFWELTSVAQLLRYRLEGNRRSISELSNALAASQRQLLVERHSHAKELRDQNEALQEQIRAQDVQHRRSMADLELELKLSRDEVNRSRSEVSKAFQRMQSMSQGLLSECERLLEVPRERNKSLTKQLQSLQARDQTWNTLCDTLRALHPIRSDDNSALANKVSALTAQLQTHPSAATAEVFAGDCADKESVAAVLAKIREEYALAISAFVNFDRIAPLQQELKEQSKELASLRADESLRSAVREAEHLEKKRMQCELEQQAELLISTRAAEQSLRCLLQALELDYKSKIESDVANVLTNAPSWLVKGGKATDESGSKALSGGKAVCVSSDTVESSRPLVSASLARGSIHEDWAPNEHRNANETPLAAHHSAIVSSNSSSVKVPSVLTPEELERRKQEILSKYGVTKRTNL